MTIPLNEKQRGKTSSLVVAPGEKPVPWWWHQDKTLVRIVSKDFKARIQASSMRNFQKKRLHIILVR